MTIKHLEIQTKCNKSRNKVRHLMTINQVLSDKFFMFSCTLHPFSSIKLSNGPHADTTQYCEVVVME